MCTHTVEIKSLHLAYYLIIVEPFLIASQAMAALNVDASLYTSGRQVQAKVFFKLEFPVIAETKFLETNHSVQQHVCAVSCDTHLIASLPMAGIDTHLRPFPPSHGVQTLP